MSTDQYIWKPDLFDKYLKSVYSMHVVIDFSTMLRTSAASLFSHLRGLSGLRINYYITNDFDKRITQLVEDKESGFCTETILEAIVPSWEQYSYLTKHLIGDDLSTYDFLMRLSQDGHICCLLTGNETEAWRHILSLNRGSVLLVTNENIYFFPEDVFKNLALQNGNVESFSNITIYDNGGMGKCETDSLENYFLFFKRRRQIHFTGIISQEGAEGVIYNTNDPEIAVKMFCESVSEQKIKKLQHFISCKEKKDNFAWPLEFIYSCNHSEVGPIGFTMPYFADVRPIEELPYLDNVTNRHRWKIAVSFLAQVLYLYLHNIQIGDYNFNNFSITNDCKAVFLDVDSYIYERYGTRVCGRQPLPFTPNYFDRENIILTDYYLLQCMVFWILSDGLWPFYYDEDIGITICHINSNSDNPFNNILESFPEKLKEYFGALFKLGRYKNPFDLFFILLDEEQAFNI